MSTWLKFSSAVAGWVPATGEVWALAVRQAPSSNATASAARFISALAGAQVIVRVSPALGLTRLERNVDIGLPAKGGADGPEIDPRQRLVGADALAEACGGVYHLEVIVAGLVAEAGEGRGDAFAFLDGAQIFEGVAVDRRGIGLQWPAGLQGEGRGQGQIFVAGGER